MKVICGVYLSLREFSLLLYLCYSWDILLFFFSGKRLGYTTEKENFHSVSLGQGQEVVAEQALETAARKGHWVILQNVHLVGT